ncbi:uncharacterized protein TRIREDRAFT_56942 [Trichoderma reesei QM6a]|uniref:Predicted protein n=2 Tax=Hypocrea jecorina TaxID=51453 RepID=G0RCN9_HYPJQ|nr:uncharacterized protein TRIREDRAFT_56942 [Trichoderma reesei QM6a]EGR51539.1 predicted protein [Trichoderma reesei QM6a]ETS04373.1 DUF1746-domain-containing protein [Trichoderma reesei RUT C-30]
MNHDAASTSSARIHDRLSPPGAAAAAGAGDAEAEADPRRRPESRQRSRSSNGRQRRRRRSKKKQNPGLAKKLAFLTHLLKTLDLVFFAELSSLYYMECSIFRFFLRAAPQYMYLTPKDESFALLMPATQLHVILIVVPNLLCMALHLFGSLPTGPEYHRGYQHGGMIIDFIGQMPAAYRLYYLVADLFILFIQCLMLTMHNQRESLRVALKTFRPLISEMVLEPIAARSPEDLDAEERGVSRHVPGLMINETDEIELQQIGRPGDGEGPEERNEQSGYAAGDSGDEPPRTHLSDIMSSGNAVLNEYHIIHTMRNAAMNTGGSTALSLQSIGYRATMASMQGRRRGATLQSSLAPPNG